MDREQLLDGLYFVRDRIDGILGFYERERQLEAQFRTEQETIGRKDTGRILSIIAYLAFGFTQLWILLPSIRVVILWKAIAVIALVAFVMPLKSIIKHEKLEGMAKKGFCTFVVLYILQFGGILIMSPIVIFVVMIPFAIIVGVAIAIINIRANKNNVKIRQINAELMQQYTQFEDEIGRLRDEMLQESGSWYPKDYYNKFAIDWFVRAVENYRCDSIKELVREYETSEYRRQMLDGQDKLYAMIESKFDEVIFNQQIMQQQLMFANVLSAINIAATLSAVGAINQNTYATQSAIDRNTYATQSLENTIKGR